MSTARRAATSSTSSGRAGTRTTWRAGALHPGAAETARPGAETVALVDGRPETVLATAASVLNGELAERIATRWRSQDAHFAEEAETELRDIGPTFETDTGRLGSNAA